MPESPRLRHFDDVLRARNELLDGTTGVELSDGELGVRVGGLPLWRRSDGAGMPHQAVRVVVQAARDTGPITFSLAGSSGVVDEKTVDVTKGRNRVVLFVPERELTRPLSFRMRRSQELLVQSLVDIPPQRKWSVSLIHHSHLDIGYTDPQSLVLSHHRKYLDSVLDLVTRTDDWPDEARFRWNVEACWPLRDWLASRPPHPAQSFMERAAAGRLEVPALPYTMHTEAYSMDELARQLWIADELRQRYGLSIETAMQTDVPGAAVGLLQALVGADVRYLSVAHNYAGRSIPYLVGGEDLSRPFYWVAAGGKRLLVWYTDSPHGMAYMEGNLLGLAEAYDEALELLPEYLAALAARP